MKIEVIQSKHLSGVHAGTKGEVVAVVGEGFAVKLESVSFIANFGGAMKTEPRTVYLERDEIRTVTPEDAI